jgi:hypothetical protein
MKTLCRNFKQAAKNAAVLASMVISGSGCISRYRGYDVDYIPDTVVDKMPLPPRPDQVPWGNIPLNGLTYMQKIQGIEVINAEAAKSAASTTQAQVARCEAAYYQSQSVVNSNNLAQVKTEEACIRDAEAGMSRAQSYIAQTQYNQEWAVYNDYTARFNQQAGVQGYASIPLTPQQASDQVTRTNQANCLNAANQVSKPGGAQQLFPNYNNYVSYARFCGANGVQFPLPPP